MPSPAEEDDDLANRALVRILAPAPVIAAFDEAVDLYRAVEGTEATITSFVEALVADALAGGHPLDIDQVPLKRGPDRALAESALARSTGNWRHLPASSTASWALALAGTSLARLEEVAREAGTGGPADLDRQIRTLISLEEEMECRLGRLLAEMGERGAWSRLRFDGVGHYAEERLGISRTSGEDRVRAARALCRFPLLREAYESGRIGLDAALLIVRILGAGPADPAVEGAWVARAEEATVKRLRDEARALGRRAVGLRALGREPLAQEADRPPSPSRPLDDAEWHASLRRGPGTARERVLRFGMLAASASSGSELTTSPDVFLRLRLPQDLAASFLAAVESSRRALSEEVDSVPWDEPWPDPRGRPSVLAARTFSIRCRRVPAWVGLLALVEEFVATWDDEDASPRRPRDAVYVRDGWRCTAPGCMSRRNLEDHHLLYRSRGGSDALSNRTCLCRFHHQRGEHGELASCGGTAPLGIVWRLGRSELGEWYSNERRLQGSPWRQETGRGRSQADGCV